MSAATSSLVSPTSPHLLSPNTAPTSNKQYNGQPQVINTTWPAVPLPSHAFSAEADAPLNLGLDEEEVVWGGESVGLGYGLLSRLKEKTNALLEAIDWDCRLWYDIIFHDLEVDGLLITLGQTNSSGKTATDPCVTRCGHLFCWSHLTKVTSSAPTCRHRT
jgi:hypothetical protein